LDTEPIDFNSIWNTAAPSNVSVGTVPNASNQISTSTSNSLDIYNTNALQDGFNHFTNHESDFSMQDVSIFMGNITQCVTAATDTAANLATAALTSTAMTHHPLDELHYNSFNLTLPQTHRAISRSAESLNSTPVTLDTDQYDETADSLPRKKRKLEAAPKVCIIAL
jgi:CCR4-NOT transcriptional regulation complex NOT5 subunit